MLRALELTRTGVWEIDADGRTTFVCDRVLAMLGYERDEILGRPLTDFMDVQAQLATEWALTRRRRGHRDVRETRVRCKDGRELWMLVSAAPVLGPDGEYGGAAACLVDISERKEMEKAAAVGGVAATAAHVSGQGGRWEWNITDDVVWWSPEVYEICGVAPESFDGTRAGFLELVHPHDRGVVTSALEAGLADGKTFSNYFRLVCPGGDVRVVYSRAELARDEGGKLRLTGTIHDVTNAPSERPTLTARERSVLDLLAQGLTLEETGARLHVSPNTVRTHVQHAIEKLRAHNRVHAIVLAIREGELTP